MQDWENEFGGLHSARTRIVSDILRLQAQRRPDKTALIYEGHRDSFAQLEKLVTDFACGLIAAGVEPGDRVAILSHNCRTFVVARFAAVRAGAIFTPINFMLNASEIGFIVDHAQPKAILVEDALCATVDQALNSTEHRPLVKAFIRHEGDAVPEGWVDADAWLASSGTVPAFPPVGEDDPVQMMYTSGTESRPKGALLSSRALLAQYVSCIVDGGMTHADVELHCLPLYHCAQLDCFLTPDFYLGATSILLRSAEAGTVLRTIAAEGVTKFFCPPTVWIALLRHPDFDCTDLSSLEKGYYGASIMPTAVIEELLRRLPGMKLWNFYGQTELAPVAAILQPEDQMRKLGSAGRPAINVETCVVNEAGRPVSIGEVGEIVHRSPQIMLGYYRDEDKTREALRDGWFHSGDLGRFDAEGFLYLVDRKKDMIKSGGENVASREVEEVLFLHPDVQEAAVFGVPDPRWIEAVTAVVVARDGRAIDVEGVLAHCRRHLAGFKCPKAIHVADSLPKNASGKILKRELRAAL